MKELFLIGALMFAPVSNAENVGGETTETPTTEEPTTDVVEEPSVFEEVVYTYVSGDTKLIITLTSETECTVKSGDTAKDGIYYLNSSGELIVETMGNHYVFTINSDNTLENVNEFDWGKWLEQWFTPEQVAMIFSWITYLVTIVFGVYKVVKMIKDKNMTAEDVANKVLENMNSEIKTQVDTILASTLKDIDSTVKKQNEYLKQNAKATALQVQNTPEAKIAMIQVLSDIGMIEQEDADKAKESIQNEVQTAEQKQENAKTAVEEVLKETEYHDEKSNGVSI